MADSTARDRTQATSGSSSSTAAASEQTAPDSQAVILHPSTASRGWLRRWPYALATAGLAVLLAPLAWVWPGAALLDPTDYAGRTRRILQTTPLIDGHNDLPWMIRIELHNRLHDQTQPFDPHQRLLGHTDLQRMRDGQVGGQFWSVYVHCDEAQTHFEDPSWIVRDTLEQIDVTRRFIAEQPADLEFCTDAACARRAFAQGRIASMLGIEGGHQLGGSLGALRQAHALGVRYITTTHNCDNAWATSASTVAARGPGSDAGLTPFGDAYVREMNRLGMLLDLSHVSHRTMRDVLARARAPVLFSHSGAYAVEPHLRNVPDDVLRQVRANGGLVMAVFVNRFLNMRDPAAATIHDVVDHIWHIATVAGWDHVGLGSDFSGTPYTPVGLEDVSQFPRLIELVMARGATDDQIRGLVGENLLRVWAAVDRRAAEIQAGGEAPVEDEWEGRTWHTGYRHSPYMFRESRDRAAREGWGEPHMFSVGKDGQHQGLKAEKQV